jgi:hypothetical protein
MALWSVAALFVSRNLDSSDAGKNEDGPTPSSNGNGRIYLVARIPSRIHPSRVIPTAYGVIRARRYFPKIDAFELGIQYPCVTKQWIHSDHWGMHYRD